MIYRYIEFHCNKTKQTNKKQTNKLDRLYMREEKKKHSFFCSLLKEKIHRIVINMDE